MRGACGEVPWDGSRSRRRRLPRPRDEEYSRVFRGAGTAADGGGSAESRPRALRRTLLRWLCPAALLLAGCFGNDIVFFSPGVEPLEENRAAYPPAEGSDLYPERFNAVFGREPGSYRWGHMKAYIHAPPAAVWAAYRTPEVITDRRSPDEADFERDVAPEYDWSFRVHYVVHAFTEVEWYEEFHFDLIEGTDDAPLFVAGRWQNVYGTPFLELVEGHHIIAAVDDQTTRIEVVEHLDAIGANDDTIPIYFDDLFRSIVAHVRGQPLPTYE